MNTFRTHRTELLLGTLLLFAFLVSAVVFNGGTERGRVQAQDGQSVPLQGRQSLLPLTPDARERAVAQSFMYALEKSHILQRTLDQSHSKEAFRLYIKKLDSRKLFFYQSDIDEFKAKYELRLVELLKQRPVDVQPAFEIYNKYLVRLKERVEMVQQILSRPIDFTVDEEYAFDKGKDFTLDENVIKSKGLQTFPKTKEEAYELWRKRLKSEVLAMKFEAITNEQKRQQALADGKEPPEIDDRDPVERLLKRYVSLQRRMLYEARIESSETLSGVRMRANDDVMELFLNSVAESLDPHSSYMSSSSMRIFEDMMKKSLEGIGAQLSTEDGYTVVRELIRGGPAEKSGELRPKDKIQGVGQGKDGKIEEVIDFKVTDVVQLIRGPKDTVVRLDILPGGKGPSKIIEIVRDKVSLADQAAQSEVFEAGNKGDGTPYRVGFIELPDFYLDTDAVRAREPNPRSATADVRAQLQSFVAKNVDAVVLDLRYNGGGSLTEAIDLSALFIGEGVVVQTKDETSMRPRPRSSTEGSIEWTGPLVVMTNKFSASASEIFAGAIKDHRRGLIIGDSNTLGKGTVQSMASLGESLLGSSNSSFGSGKITIQGFYRPSGITTQGIGVDADIMLPSLTEAMENVIEAELDNVLTLQRVNPAPDFTPGQLVSAQLIAELQRRSSARIRVNDEFVKLQERVALYKESREKRRTPLNEEKYMEEMKRLNTDEWEREELEDNLLSTEKKIKRDFYVDEALAITVDYIKAGEEFGIAYPRERTIRAQPRRSWFGLGF